uniref:Uncharacterized protein n=1 Tax=Timema bartmani TaxID=61472 RepID=A0A7R9F3T9_9NEOP|nr:unnamed protein product [Timema bartmani]
MERSHHRKKPNMAGNRNRYPWTVSQIRRPADHRAGRDMNRSAIGGKLSCDEELLQSYYKHVQAAVVCGAYGNSAVIGWIDHVLPSQAPPLTPSRVFPGDVIATLVPLGLSTGGRRLGSNPCLGCLMAGREVGVLITAETWVSDSRCDITLMSDDVTGKNPFPEEGCNIIQYHALSLSRLVLSSRQNGTGVAMTSPGKPIVT